MEKELAWEFILLMFKSMKNKQFELKLNISTKQFMVLAASFMHAEAFSQPITVSELADKFLVSKSAISQMVNVLEEKQYLTRITSSGDRRIVGLSVTDKGRCEMENARLQIIEYASGRLQKLGKEKTEQLINLLTEFCNT
jgi:DNA-binding MarR family transcriptional regulator